jgi:hypothetical protein
MIKTDKHFNSTDFELQITEWLPPNAKSETQYGVLTNLEWCAKEKERIGNCDIYYSNILRRVCLKWDESQLEERRRRRIV